MRYITALCLAAMSSSLIANSYHYHEQSVHPLTRALRVGVDTNGKPLFLCVARIFNSMQPGKTWPGYGKCNVAYGGREYIVNNFEIPTSDAFRNAFWQDNTYGAIRVGRDTNGTPLFLCQTLFKGSKQPGKTWPNYGHCNISYAGQEIITDHYRVLAHDLGNTNYHQHPNQPTPRVIIR